MEKESYLVSVAVYAKVCGIDDEPALRDEIPTSVEHAFALDRKDEFTLWRDALGNWNSPMSELPSEPLTKERRLRTTGTKSQVTLRGTLRRILPERVPHGAAYYQSVIGVLRWIVNGGLSTVDCQIWEETCSWKHWFPILRLQW